MAQTMASSQSIPIPQGAPGQDRVGRNRQPSECVREQNLLVATKFDTWHDTGLTIMYFNI